MSNLSQHRMQFFILIILILGGIFYLYLEHTNQTLSDFSLKSAFFVDYSVIRIGEVPVEVEVANTEAARRQGLSGRSSIGQNEGMLFVFPESGYHGIWMKDMQFPIDVVWISEDFEVVDIMADMSPSSYPHIFEPREPAKYVLETETLFIETFGIGIGQKVHIPESLQVSH